MDSKDGLGVANGNTFSMAFDTNLVGRGLINCPHYNVTKLNHGCLTLQFSQPKAEPHGRGLAPLSAS